MIHFSGDNSAVVRMMHDALNLARYLKARRVRGKLAGRLGKILFALGEHSRALHFFRVALQSSDPMPADVSDFAANPRHR